MLFPRANVLGCLGLTHAVSNFRAAQMAVYSLAAFKRNHENVITLLARTAGPAGTVLQCFSDALNVGVNDEAQIGQINTARCHVRRHAYTRTAVPQRDRKSTRLNSSH